MKNKLFKLFLISVSILNICGCGKNVSRETIPQYNPENIYSQLMLVNECYYNSNGTATIQLINCNGFTYGYKTEDQDVCLNDYYSVVFYDNETEYIYDDIIIGLKYDRPDLLSQYENNGNI